MEIIRPQSNSGVNSVQQFSAVNAFRSNKNITKPADEEPKQEEPSGIKSSATANILDRIDVDEIKKYAGYVGEFDVTEEDIKYGMLYGRSVIAEWLC